MNSNTKAFIEAFVRSWLGQAVGTLVLLAIVRVFIYGPGAVVSVFDPSVMLGTLFTFNALMFAFFYVTFVAQRGVSWQNTMQCAGIWIAFGAVFALVLGGLSIPALFMMALQGVASSIGAHGAMKVKI
jgi:hypothetical protein